MEKSQNSQRLSWSRDEVDAKLREIIDNIHSSCIRFGDNGDGPVDYVSDANIAGFIKLADAMKAPGIY